MRDDNIAETFRLPRTIFLLFAVCCSCFHGYAQRQMPDTNNAASPRIPLDEIVVNNKVLKRFNHHLHLGLPVIHWNFHPGSEHHFRWMDSSFDLTPVAALSSGRIRLREVRLRLPSWDTGRMRLNLMVLQIHNADTSYAVRPIPKDVHGKWLRMRLNDIEIEPSAFFIGYSFCAFKVSEDFSFRMFMRESERATAVMFDGGSLNFNSRTGPKYIIPFELYYDEI